MGRSRSWSPAAASVLAALLAGCTSPDTHDRSASSGTDAGSASSESPTSRPEQLEQLVTDVLGQVVADTREVSPAGAVVAVSTTHAEVVAGAGGHDAARSGAPSGQDALRIASLTKPFTAAVALLLVEEGALDLDAPLGDVAEATAGELEHGDEITLRSLLSHTSGLGDVDEDYLQDLVDAAEVDGGEVDGGEDDGDGVADVAGRLEVACDQAQRVARSAGPREQHRPHEDFAYSNAGYLVVGDVLEEVTGEPLATLYRRHLFDPLDLDDTWLDCAEPPGAAVAPGFHPPGLPAPALPGGDDGWRVVTDLERRTGAAAGLLATAADVATFARALFTDELFEQPDTLATMLAPVEPAPGGADLDYGLGVDRRDGVYGHDGQVTGYWSELRYDADADVVVVAMTNQTGGPARLLAEQVLATVVAEEQEAGEER